MKGKNRFSLIVICLALLAMSCAGNATAPPASPQAPAATAAPNGPSPTVKPAAEQPKPGGILNVSARLTPQHWDIHQAGSSGTLWPLGPIYSSLIRYDWTDNEKVAPDLAETWNVSEDGKVYTFNLRKGVKWHDGQPFTSADVKFSLDRIRKPPQGMTSPRKTLLQSISDIQTPDDYTVKITTSYPDASLLTVIAMPWNSILPKHVIEEKGDMKTSIVGTGPFIFKNYSPGVSFDVVKNPDYFIKGLPYLDGITRYYLTDSTKRFAAFRAGQVDIVEYGSFDVTQAEQIAKELPQVKVLDQRGVCWDALYFNLQRKPWDDLRVRQAVNLAFDRENYIKVGLEGRGDVGWVVPPISAYAIPKAELSQMPGFRQPKDADLAQAKKLMTDAGIADGLKPDMVWRAGDPRYEPGATYAHDQLAKLGIDAQLRALETAPLFEAMTGGNFDVLNFGYCTTMADPNDVLGYFLSNDSRNYSKYKNAEVDKLFQEQSQTLDTAKRKDLVIQIQRKLLDDLPAIIMGWRAHIMGWYTKVKDFAPGYTVYNNLDYYKVWLGQ